MNRLVCPVLIITWLSVGAAAQSTEKPATAVSDAANLMAGLKAAIEKHLGRPYVWGSAGIKSFDCSGFLWRVMYENGILTKRTTARKYYMMLPAAPEEEAWNFGTVIFFDNLKHVGLVDTESAFYHAQVTRGTNRSEMNSFWRKKIYGFRRLPAREVQ